MKYITLFLFVFQLNVYAQEKEGDLNLPVADIEEIEKQEEELPPTIDEVEMEQEEVKPEKDESGKIKRKLPVLRR